ncbi:MAG: response regulator [Kofleriaceae bacterium]
MTRDKRYEMRAPVSLVVDYEGAEDFLGDYTENLSRGGTFIQTTRDLAVGHEIQLVLSFPGLLLPISVDAIVRWRREGEAPGVGVEFLQGSGRDKLAEIVDRIEQRDPKTVQRVIEVLVVEDNRHISELVRNGLEVSGRRGMTDVAFNVATADDGGVAMQLLKANRYDVAIVDVYLPVIDGSSVIAQARQDLGLRGLAIIAVSAGGDAARHLAMAAGADLFIDKPMRLRQVIASIHELVHVGAAA